MSSLLIICVFLVLVLSSNGFAPTARTSGQSAAIKPFETRLMIGIPSFLEPKKDDIVETKNTKNSKKVSNNKSKNVVEDTTEKKSVGLAGILQLIAAGAGAPFLGDYQGVDKETGKFMFSLEANNLVDEKGQSKQTKMPYFENGWVDENDTGFQWPWEKKK